MEFGRASPSSQLALNAVADDVVGNAEVGDQVEFTTQIITIAPS